MRVSVDQTVQAGPPLPGADGKLGFFAGGSRMRELQRILPQVGASDVPVLIQGETGCGKEMFARQLHLFSPRASRPFLKLNCAALPSELIESELFGYERGAFTGAFQKKAGIFELADGGTILLDEIGDMQVGLQAKFLHVLQDHEFQRLGGKEAVRVNVRVMAATHRDLEKAIADGEFREDLYYRLNVVSVHLPPLRERREDILALAGFLLEKHATAGAPVPLITPALRQKMVEYDWPGNVRELENVVRSFLVFGDPEAILHQLEYRMRRGQPAVARAAAAAAGGMARPVEQHPSILDEVSRAKDYAEREAIVHALDARHWNRKKAALMLGLDYKALLYKMKKLGIGEPS